MSVLKDFILIGQAGSGKDTAYEIMNSIEPKYQRLAFGDEIRNISKTIRDYPTQFDTYTKMTMLFHPRLPPKDLQRKLHELSMIPYEPPKDRRLLQELGTWAREYDDEIWMRVVSDEMKRSDSAASYVITDCRRRSELTKFRGLVSVYIECPEDIRLERLKKRDVTFDEVSLRHRAEREIPSLREDCDFIVYNDGDMDYLREQLEELLKYVNF